MESLTFFGVSVEYFGIFQVQRGKLRSFHCNSEKSEHEALENSSVIHPTSLQKPNVFQYALYQWCGEESGALLMVFHCIRERLYDLGSARECTVCLALIALFPVHLPEFYTH
jgi:hypothetical protein